VDAVRADTDHADAHPGAGDHTDGPVSFLLRHGWARSGGLVVRSL
jgi:hypothetical protein